MFRSAQQLADGRASPSPLRQPTHPHHLPTHALHRIALSFQHNAPAAVTPAAYLTGQRHSIQHKPRADRGTRKKSKRRSRRHNDFARLPCVQITHLVRASRLACLCDCRPFRTAAYIYIYIYTQVQGRRSVSRLRCRLQQLALACCWLPDSLQPIAPAPCLRFAESQLRLPPITPIRRRRASSQRISASHFDGLPFGESEPAPYCPSAPPPLPLQAGRAISPMLLPYPWVQPRTSRPCAPAPPVLPLPLFSDIYSQRRRDDFPWSPS